MARLGYMTVETTNVLGSVNFSLQANKDIENGAIVGKGGLVAGEKSIYEATDAYTDGMYLVANPAWSYVDNYAVDQNEENYINKADLPFRTYRLEKDMKFKISNIADGVTLNVGDYVEFTAGAYAVAVGTTKLKVVDVEEVGFPYCIGSYGVAVAGDSTNKYGSAMDARVKKYTIEVVA